MSKPTHAKFLLTRLTVTRDDGSGKSVRRTLPANTTQLLTADEVELLDKLTVQSGRPHYREPRDERVIRGEDDGLNVDLPGYVSKDSGDGVDQEDDEDGDLRPLDFDGMTVKELKAYLDAEPAAEYKASDDKAALLALAKAKAAQAVDPDGGL